jgi:hemolysin-activating ACP:hemolysin acyltransferase
MAQDPSAGPTSPGEGSANGASATPAAKAAPGLHIFRPTDPFAALGLAVNHLMTKPAFGNLKFGDWSRILVGQINRKHFFFVVDDKKQVQGFCGWALANKANAEAWAEGRGALSFKDSMQGECVIFNAWAGTSLKVNRFILHEARKVIADKELVYFKRHYKDGTTRTSRLTVTEFVSQHIERAGG